MRDVVLLLISVKQESSMNVVYYAIVCTQDT